jgi:hypothetical protein
VKYAPIQKSRGVLTARKEGQPDERDPTLFLQKDLLIEGFLFDIIDDHKIQTIFEGLPRCGDRLIVIDPLQSYFRLTHVNLAGFGRGGHLDGCQSAQKLTIVLSLLKSAHFVTYTAGDEIAERLPTVTITVTVIPAGRTRDRPIRKQRFSPADGFASDQHSTCSQCSHATIGSPIIYHALRTIAMTGLSRDSMRS